MRRTWSLIAAILLLAACSDDESGAVADVAPDSEGDSGDATGDGGFAGTGCTEIPCETLSEYGLFLGDGSTQEPVAGVVPYEVNVQLFADQSVKFRFLRVPEGETIGYDGDQTWSLPTGTIIVKTFAYLTDARDPSLGFTLMETRLLIHETDSWTAHTYVWNTEQTEATRTVAGQRVSASWIDGSGEAQTLEYRVPNTNQCAQCHGSDVLSPLGPHTRQLDRSNTYAGASVNQIDHLASLGWFGGEVPPAAQRVAFPAIDDAGADLDARARGYLDANCSHCHDAQGAARSTGLWLDWRITDPTALGVCRVPFAAGAGTGGRLWDVVPGAPDESIMVYRMESTEQGVKMPELPSQLSDEDGVALIRAWIAAMEPVDCSEL